MAFSQAQVNEYVHHDGDRCPYCGSDKVLMPLEKQKGLSICQHLCECGTCGNEWMENFKIISIKEVA